MEDEKPQEASRLGVQDKRNVFQTLLGMSERLLQLNKFPAEMGDFALSLHPQEVEDAWLLLRQNHKNTLSPATSTVVTYKDTKFKLHAYDDVRTYDSKLLFMTVSTLLDISNARRHCNAVKSWCERQLRLEQQLIATMKTIKDIVCHCNTVGQYKKVSPDLLTFLPEKYKAGLRNYSKGSPYPSGLKSTSTDAKAIERMLGTLAYAALQPKHKSEERYLSQQNNYHKPSYGLIQFPRTVEYDQNEARSLNI